MKQRIFIGCILIILIFIFIGGYIFWCLNREPKFNENAIVHIKKNEKGFQLYKNGEPFYIKGAGGDYYFKELSEIGANTVRVYDTLNLELKLNEAQKYNLAVIVDLPIYRFSNTYNPYLNDSITDALKINVEKTVQRYKNHPALLMWNLGNELQYPTVINKNRIAENFDDIKKIAIELYNRRSFVKTFNELIDIIHQKDPNHLVTTSLATNNFWRKVLSIHLFSPELDIIGYNIFAPPERIRVTFNRLSNLMKFKPYYISEWGIEGPWAQEKTIWNAPVEATSTRKGGQYLENHHSFEELYPESIGNTAFYWGQKQERTHTWFSIFDKEGRKSQAYYSLNNIWKEQSDEREWPPQIKYMLLNNKGSRDNLIFNSNEIIQSKLLFEYNTDTTLQYIWEIFEEEWNYAGEGVAHKEAKKINVDFVQMNDSIVSFKTPNVEGPYRIYVNVNDSKGNFASANTPFYVLTPGK